jgi:dienelactone hydrolase
VIVVDDGIATGSTARAAVEVARAHGAARVVLAVPVAPPETVVALESVADEVVAVETPAHLYAIGGWYDNFAQTSDNEVVALLAAANPGSPAAPLDAEVTVPAGAVTLAGHLTVPDAVQGLVIFAHGSGSGRLSPRNQYVARQLNAGGLATLLFDLLTEDESRDRGNVFDIALLARRLGAAFEWTGTHPRAADLPVGYFGASTGAAAALVSAAELGPAIGAVVSRGGRPDLAGSALARVRAPTLLIVGGRDDTVIEVNRQAASALACEHRIDIVPGATHLFEEPGTLEAVARLACDWFLRHLATVPTPNLRQ